MRGVVFTGHRKLELRELPKPIPGPREVIVQIKAPGMFTHRFKFEDAFEGHRLFDTQATGKSVFILD